MNVYRVSIAAIAVLLISYAALPSCSEAATVTELIGQAITSQGAKMKIRSTRSISVWRATVNTVTNCWLITLPTKYPNTGQSVDLWNIVEISGSPLTEAQCYDAPLPK